MERSYGHVNAARKFRYPRWRPCCGVCLTNKERARAIKLNKINARRDATTSMAPVCI